METAAGFLLSLGVLPSHNKQQLRSCSQKLEAVSRAKGELTVTWSPWKLKHCLALSRVTWQSLEYLLSFLK